MSRVMAKTIEAEITRDDEGNVKGAPLQSKINAFTKGKNIDGVHSLELVSNGSKQAAVVVFSLGEGDGDRVYSKVIGPVPVGSDVQKKVNAFSKGKDLTVLAAATSTADGQTTAAILYTKQGGDDSE